MVEKLMEHDLEELNKLLLTMAGKWSANSTSPFAR